MRGAAVVVNRVARTENFTVLTYLDKEVTLYDDVKLLTVVRGKLNFRLVNAVVIRDADIKRLCNTVLESISKVVLRHTVSLAYLLSEP